ncbi:MAG: tetratricopeptide repeat protein [Candidatus Kapaibacterium sp.]
MHTFLRSLGLLVFFFTTYISYGQTNKEAALSKGLEAVKLLDEGKIDESILLLQQAQQLDPERVDYPYELAYAYYAKADYSKAIALLEQYLGHKDVTDRFFQLLGNSYDELKNTEKALAAYTAGLQKFPASGSIYLEIGNIYLNKKEYGKALGYYEKGIEVEPKFPSNYYHAARLYCSSSEEVWGMIYGEIFMNLERNSKRTSEISKLLYDTYKHEIKFTSDTSFSVSFSSNSIFIPGNLQDPSAMKLPFGVGVYEPTLMFSMFFITSISIHSLDTIRSAFIDNYFKNGHDKQYPNVLFSYQKRLKDAGHSEAYNHWILMKGDEDGFVKWKAAHAEKWAGFVTWFTANPLQLDDTHKFYSRQY